MRIFIFNLFKGKHLGRSKIVQKILEILIRLLNPVKVLDHRMFLNPKDDALGVFTIGSYEPEVVDIFKKHIKKGDTVLDIGAYIGYHTLIMAKLVGEEGKVFAFEPDPVNFQYLIKNAAENGYRNIVAFQKAVSDKTGKGRLFMGDSSSLSTIYDTGGKKYKEIETIKIDDYFGKKRVDLAKIDAEGAEALILEGMKETIKNNPQLKMVIECQSEMLKKGGSSPKELLESLKSFGFKSIQIDNKDLFCEKDKI